jgi:hypothetical protein
LREKALSDLPSTRTFAKCKATSQSSCLLVAMLPQNPRIQKPNATIIIKKMRGTVKKINPKNGYFAIEIERNSYSIFEILSSNSIDVGDIINGQLQELGDAILTNESKAETINGIIQNYDCTEQQLKQQLKF